MNSLPILRKAKKVTGKTLVFRDATPDDATFILSLRTDSQKAKYLSSVSGEINKQIEWLQNYSKSDDQVYFIITNVNNELFGTVRLYDSQGESFCWGSWILKTGVPQSSAIESALMVYSFAIDHLGFRQAHFDVRKGNETVWRFHERFGAVKVRETELDYEFQIGSEAIQLSRQRYRKYLPESVQVEEIK
jgi:RimJ/RimL family protein N-acetyltransferase